MDPLRSNKAPAFTLLENLVAVIVFATAAIGWMMFSASLSKSTGESEVAAQAAVIAQSVVDDLRLIPFETEPQEENDLNRLIGTTTTYEYDLFGKRVDEFGTDVFYSVEVNADLVEGVTPLIAEVSVTVNWSESQFAGGSEQNGEMLTFVEVNFRRTVSR